MTWPLFLIVCNSDKIFFMLSIKCPVLTLEFSLQAEVVNVRCTLVSGRVQNWVFIFFEDSGNNTCIWRLAGTRSGLVGVHILRGCAPNLLDGSSASGSNIWCMYWYNGGTIVRWHVGSCGASQLVRTWEGLHYAPCTMHYTGLDNQLNMHICCNRRGGLLRIKRTTKYGLNSFPYWQ